MNYRSERFLSFLIFEKYAAKWYPKHFPHLEILLSYVYFVLLRIKCVGSKTFLRNVYFKKQPSRGVLRKRYSKNMKQIYRRTPMPNCDFNKVAYLQAELPCRSVIWLFTFSQITLRHGCSPVNLLHIFITAFLKNTSGWLLLRLFVTSSQTFSFELNSSRTYSMWNISYLP